MGDSLGTIFVIFITAVLLFIFPLMSLADRTDDISQMSVQAATTEFVDKVRTTGVLTMDDYSAFEQRITSTGTAYNIELGAQFTDENTGKKTTQANSSKLGENEYVGQYNSQLMTTLKDQGKVVFKEGDIFSASVRNRSSTIAQQLKNFFYSVTGNDIYTIAAEHSGYVTANGEV